MIQACRRGGRGNQAGSRESNVRPARKFRTAKGELFAGKPGHESGRSENPQARSGVTQARIPGFFGSGGPIAATMCGAVKIASLVTSVTVWLFALS